MLWGDQGEKIPGEFRVGCGVKRTQRITAFNPLSIRVQGHEVQIMTLTHSNSNSNRKNLQEEILPKLKKNYAVEFAFSTYYYHSEILANTSLFEQSS